MKKQLFALLTVGAMATTVFAAADDKINKINELIPQIAADKVEDRYAPQIELQLLCADASKPGAEAERATVAKYLSTKAADASVKQPARVWIVRQLERMGSAECVSTLATLLKDQDAELKETARRALEKNPAPTASEPLRNALKSGGTPEWQIGLMRSLGERRDTESVPLLAAKLNDPAPGVAAVAAMNLGNIGGDAAVQALTAALDKKTTGAADALILAANQLLKEGKGNQAKPLYETVLKSQSSARGAGLFGLARADAAGTEKRITEALAGNDVKLQQAVLSAAVVVYVGKLTPALAAMVPTLAPTIKGQVIRVLDASAEKTVITATADADESVRVAALESLGKIGTASAVPALLKASAGDAAEDKKAAEWALARIAGAGALPAIEKQAAEGDAKLRAAAIGALASQFDKAALPAVLKYAADTDATVNKAAFTALKRVGTDNEIEGLAKLAITDKSASAVEALQAVVGRATDKPGALKKLSAIAAGADAKGQGAYLDILTGMGGNEAMNEVVKATDSKDADVRDGAVRALSKWPEFVATKKLADIAADANALPKHQILAVRGIARLVDSCDKEPAQARIDAALNAFKLAKRPDEKKIALAALATVADKKSVTAFKTLLAGAELKENVGLAAAALANNLIKPNKGAAKELATSLVKASISEAVNKKANAVLQKIEAK
ncbi:MAG: HEAT repeat domain-containing protein [Verrucomicrobiota bacterium]